MSNLMLQSPPLIHQLKISTVKSLKHPDNKCFEHQAAGWGLCKKNWLLFLLYCRTHCKEQPSRPWRHLNTSSNNHITDFKSLNSCTAPFLRPPSAVLQRYRNCLIIILLDASLASQTPLCS